MFVAEVALDPKDRARARSRSELFKVAYEGNKLTVELLASVADAPEECDCTSTLEPIVCEVVRQFVLLRQATWHNLETEQPT